MGSGVGLVVGWARPGGCREYLSLRRTLWMRHLPRQREEREKRKAGAERDGHFTRAER